MICFITDIPIFSFKGQCQSDEECGGSTDTCDSGTCKCGMAEPCGNLTDTCINGLCQCGSQHTCDQKKADMCSAGICKCGNSIECNGILRCINGSCRGKPRNTWDMTKHSKSKTIDKTY